jgi:hypothetical protein
LDLIVQLILDKQTDLPLRLAALGLLKSVDSYEALKEIASSSAVESEVSLLAVYSIFELGSFESVVQSIGPSVAGDVFLESLREVVDCEQARMEVRKVAVRALAKLKAADTLLVAVSNENMNPDFRVFLIQQLVLGGWALDLIGDSRVDQRVRSAAIVLLGKLHQADTLVALLRRKEIDRSCHDVTLGVLMDMGKTTELIAVAESDEPSDDVRAVARELARQLRDK